eukprot:gene13189-15583_t
MAIQVPPSRSEWLYNLVTGSSLFLTVVAVFNVLALMCFRIFTVGKQLPLTSVYHTIHRAALVNYSLLFFMLIVANTVLSLPDPNRRQSRLHNLYLTMDLVTLGVMALHSLHALDWVTVYSSHFFAGMVACWPLGLITWMRKLASESNALQVPARLQMWRERQLLRPPKIGGMEYMTVVVTWVRWTDVEQFAGSKLQRGGLNGLKDNLRGLILQWGTEGRRSFQVLICVLDILLLVFLWLDVIENTIEKMNMNEILRVNEDVAAAFFAPGGFVLCFIAMDAFRVVTWFLCQLATSATGSFKDIPDWMKGGAGAVPWSWLKRWVSLWSPLEMVVQGLNAINLGGLILGMYIWLHPAYCSVAWNLVTLGRVLFCVRCVRLMVEVAFLAASLLRMVEVRSDALQGRATSPINIPLDKDSVVPGLLDNSARDGDMANVADMDAKEFTQICSLLISRAERRGQSTGQIRQTVQMQEEILRLHTSLTRSSESGIS